MLIVVVPVVPFKANAADSIIADVLLFANVVVPDRLQLILPPLLLLLFMLLPVFWLLPIPLLATPF